MRINPATALHHVDFDTSAPLAVRLTYNGSTEFILFLENSLSPNRAAGSVNDNVSKERAPRAGVFAVKERTGYYTTLTFDLGGVTPLYTWIFPYSVWSQLPPEFCAMFRSDW